MRHIDEDTITQAVIARHAAAGDARLRELMTSLVQHLHAFAREAGLTQDEWARGLAFVAECARAQPGEPRELALLSDALGLSTLVASLDARRARGATATALPWASQPDGCDAGDAALQAAPLDDAEPCFVRGEVRSADGAPIAGAEVRVWPSGVRGEKGVAALTRSDEAGAFVARCALAHEQEIAHDGPVARLLQALGRHAWRPAHLHFMISAPGHERLVTHVFRDGDRYLDTDAVFGVRRTLVADWVQHAPGRTPDGRHSTVPFTTLDFAFVLSATRGDLP